MSSNQRTTTNAAPSAEYRPVSSMETARLAFDVLLRQVATRGRLLAMGALGLAVVALGLAVGANQNETDALNNAVSIISNVGFAIAVPVVALVFGAGVLGETREDGTLVYLWLRPLHRWPVVLGAFAAAITVVLPLTVVPLTAAAAALDVGGELVVATTIAATVGTLAYVAVFLLLSLLVKNAVVWGLAYILIWEGVAAGLGAGPARLAIRGYTRSILTDRTGVSLDLGDLTQASGILVPLIVAVVALALASWRLNRLDVA